VGADLRYRQLPMADLSHQHLKERKKENFACGKMFYLSNHRSKNVQELKILTSDLNFFFF
jgi:hypothetical protein